MPAPLGENFSNQDTEQPDVNKIKKEGNDYPLTMPFD